MIHAESRIDMTMKMTVRRSKLAAFTLVELMIVLALVSIIVAVSASAVIRAQVTANEGSARASVKAVQSGALAYRTTKGVYPTDLTALGAGYVGGGLESGTKGGYLFTIVSGNGGFTYTLTAVPASAGFSGTKGYCSDTNNTIFEYVDGSSITGDGASCPSGGVIVS